MTLNQAELFKDLISHSPQKKAEDQADNDRVNTDSLEIALERLNDLMKSAAKDTAFRCEFNGDKEKYNECRDFCFGKIWEEFWDVKSRITGVPGDWCDPDTTYEEDMQAYLRHANLYIRRDA